MQYFEIPILPSIILGPFNLHVWGFFVALGILAAYFLAARRFKKLAIDSKHLDRLFFRSIVLAFVGARLLYVLIEFDVYIASPLKIFKIWQGGLAFSGGLLLALLGIILYGRKHRLDLWQLADALAVPLAAALAVGRFGCLFSGLHVGLLTEYGAVFNGGGELRAAWPFYAILNWFIALTVLLRLEKKSLTKGALAQIMLVWWALWRLFGDFIRADASVPGGDPRYGGLTPTQYLAVAVLLAAIFVIFRLVHQPSTDTPIDDPAKNEAI